METISKAFDKALKKKYGIGAFNFYNLETLQAIMDAGEEMKAPVICSVSEGALEYMGLNTTVLLFESLNQDKKYPAFLHLDHGKSFEICKKVIDAGFDSVMIDGSALSFKENTKLTKKVVNYANKYGVWVEGEIGALAGIEENINNSDKAKFTDPQEAKYFVELTGVDCLAIAIGTSHGAYKFTNELKLKIEILEEIEENLPNFPLVLHGASSIDAKLIEKINKNGGKIVNAKGVCAKDLTEVCTKHNICKVNADTDLRLAFIGTTREILNGDISGLNPRKFLSESKIAMQKVVEERIKIIKPA